MPRGQVGLPGFPSNGIPHAQDTSLTWGLGPISRSPEAADDTFTLYESKQETALASAPRRKTGRRADGLVGSTGVVLGRPNGLVRMRRRRLADLRTLKATYGVTGGECVNLTQADASRGLEMFVEGGGGVGGGGGWESLLFVGTAWPQKAADDVKRGPGQRGLRGDG